MQKGVFFVCFGDPDNRGTYTCTTFLFMIVRLFDEVNNNDIMQESVLDSFVCFCCPIISQSPEE